VQRPAGATLHREWRLVMHTLEPGRQPPRQSQSSEEKGANQRKADSRPLGGGTWDLTTPVYYGCTQYTKRVFELNSASAIGYRLRAVGSSKCPEFGQFGG
jgi:hypothetical protein